MHPGTTHGAQPAGEVQGAVVLQKIWQQQQQADPTLQPLWKTYGSNSTTSAITSERGECLMELVMLGENSPSSHVCAL
jgi:hypothetical protein